jgi:hypothetical protein
MREEDRNRSVIVPPTGGAIAGDSQATPTLDETIRHDCADERLSSDAVRAAFATSATTTPVRAASDRRRTLSSHAFPWKWWACGSARLGSIREDGA